MKTADKQLVTQATMALEVYRLTLTPGFYHFASEMVDGKPTGRISERWEALHSAVQEKESSVIFSFWPDGFAPDRCGDPGEGDQHWPPPPIEEVSQLDRAPDLFLSCLTEHLYDKLLLLAQQSIAGAGELSAREPSSKRPDSQQLVAEASMALEVYRRMLKPGHYRFYAEKVNGELTGRIVEEKKEIHFPGKVPEMERGVLFGFWPMGPVADQFAADSPLQQVVDFPQIVEVSRLFRAPDSFLEILTRHVNQKTGLDAIR